MRLILGGNKIFPHIYIVILKNEIQHTIVFFCQYRNTPLKESVLLFYYLCIGTLVPGFRTPQCLWFRKPFPWLLLLPKTLELSSTSACSFTVGTAKTEDTGVRRSTESKLQHPLPFLNIKMIHFHNSQQNQSLINSVFPMKFSPLLGSAE